MKARAQFSKNLSEPLFRQLMAYIADQIRSGAFSPDKPLPSLNAMAIQTGLSKETVIKAYAHLCKGGVLNSLPGKGYFVREGYLPALDQVKSLKNDSHKTIVELQARYAEAPGISNLKIKYNNVSSNCISICYNNCFCRLLQQIIN